MTARAARPEFLGDLRQVASVRKIVLDEDVETGVRALLFSTGGGLDFMVLVDRTLDIGTLHYRGVPVAWQSAAGFCHPSLSDPDTEGGFGFAEVFSGFLVTCGLEHIRQPSGGSPLHGRLPVTPARLTASGVDWSAPEPVAFCEGEIVQRTEGGEHFLMRRRIEAPVGSTSIRLTDWVQNCGTTATPQALLYHTNFGYPAIQDGTVVMMAGQPLISDVRLGDCGTTPTVRCKDAAKFPTDQCQIHTPAEANAFMATIGFSSDTLPFVQVWSDLRPGMGVVALEPCTSDRNPDGTSKVERDLGPGEVRTYQVRFEFSGEAPVLNWSA